MAELTPMMKQYLEIKEQNKDSILFFRLGDFYEMFGADARTASRELDLTLTTRDKDKNKAFEDKVPMCGIPYHSSDGYIARLIAKGYKVAICEQTEDPATAKGLAFAWNVPIISVPTVDAIAYNMAGAEGLVCPILDARRQQTYTGIYSFHTNADHTVAMDVLRPECAISIEEIIEDLNERGQKVTFLGDGIPVFRDRIREELTVPYSFAPFHERLQRAGALAALANV